MLQNNTVNAGIAICTNKSLNKKSQIQRQNLLFISSLRTSSSFLIWCEEIKPFSNVSSEPQNPICGMARILQQFTQTEIKSKQVDEAICVQYCIMMMLVIEIQSRT